MNDTARNVQTALMRAIMTLKALPGGSIGPVFPANSIAARVVREWDAYGAEEEKVRFQPTPHDVSIYLDVLGWLTWYEHNVDARHAQVFWAWSLDKPVRTIKKRFNVSARTIYQWLEDVPERIVNRFATEIARLGLDALHELRDLGASPCKPDDSVAAPLPRSPTYARTLDAVPTREAAHVEGSRAHRDRQRTVKRLEKNMRKHDRLKRQAERRKAQQQV